MCNLFQSYRNQENIVEPVSKKHVLLTLAENQSLKQQLERMHTIIKCYAH